MHCSLRMDSLMHNVCLLMGATVLAMRLDEHVIGETQKREWALDRL